jgi:hypothetical protein
MVKLADGHEAATGFVPPAVAAAISSAFGDGSYPAPTDIQRDGRRSDGHS